MKSKLKIFIKYCPKIGICYDTGNSISENKDFVKEISYLSRVINHIHLKDKIKKGKKFYNTYLGNGLLDFYKLKVTLNRINYKKKITLECFYGNYPIQDSVKNLEFARKNLIYEHFKETKSEIADKILQNFNNEIKFFKQVCPKEMLDKLQNPLTLKTKVLKAV